MTITVIDLPGNGGSCCSQGRARSRPGRRVSRGIDFDIILFALSEPLWAIILVSLTVVYWSLFMVAGRVRSSDERFYRSNGAGHQYL